MLPDCLAMEQNKARQMLKSSGIGLVEIVITGPPRGGSPQGEARVVRQRLKNDGTCQLVVAYRQYLSAGQCT